VLAVVVLAAAPVAALGDRRASVEVEVQEQPL
jgi:hypothetical protein